MTSTTILPARQADVTAAAEPGPDPRRPSAPGALSATVPEPARLARLLEDARARRGRLDVEIAGAEKAMAALVADRRAAQEAFERAAAGEAGLVVEKARLLGRMATARDALRAADLQAAVVADIGRTTPVAHPPARGETPAERGARAQRAVADAVRRAGELADLAGANLDELARAGEQAQAAAARVEALAGQVRTAEEALGALSRELAEVAEDLTASPGLTGALAVAAEPSALALADIPPAMLQLYRRAASRCPGLPWSVLAAIGSVETSHGRAQLPGVRVGANFAGAMGPMQFLAPTWDSYGADGDGDGTRDVYSPADAIFGAANYLCASGAGQPSGLAPAIWAYNHADPYVEAVLAVAAGYGAVGLATDRAVGAALVESPNLILSPQARADIVDGLADTRLLALLGAASARHTIAVSVIRTGHARTVSGTDRVSNHYEGRGVDIYAVDGAAVSASNPAALELALSILASGPAIRPDELGSPWTSLGAFAGAFSDEDHADHLHLGWRPNPPELQQMKDSGGGVNRRP